MVRSRTVMTTALESQAPVTLTLPLQSDPPWLQPAVLGVGAASIGAFVLLFAQTVFPAALGVLPGVALGVFAGSALAARSRRRGATVHLQVARQRLEVADPDELHTVLDLTAPFSAALLIDRTTKRRMLVLGQEEDPIVVLEPVPSAEAVTAPWSSRTVTLDLDALALTPASPKVVALAEGQTLAPLLAQLASALEPTTALLSQPTAGGRLVIRHEEVRFGTRDLPLDGTVKAIPYAVQANGLTVAAVGLTQGEGAAMLFACEDAFVEKGAVTGNLTPDAYLPLATYEILRRVVEHRTAG